MIVYLGLESGTNIIAKLIQWVRNTKWSHCFIAFGDDQDPKNITVIEADASGVIVSLLSDRDYKSATLKRLPLRTDLDPKELLHDIMKYKGKPYGYLQLFGFVIPSLLERIGISAKNIFKQGIICSELFWLIGSKIIDRDSETFKKLMTYDRNTFAPDEADSCTIESECPVVNL